MEVETNLKDLVAKNIFKELEMRDNINILAIKAQNAISRYDFHEAYKICLK